MRITRVRRAKIQKRKIKKFILSFFIVIPVISVIAGYLITNIIVLPSIYK